MAGFTIKNLNHGCPFALVSFRKLPYWLSSYFFSFDVPEGLDLGQPVAPKTAFVLYDDQKSIQDSAVVYLGNRVVCGGK